MGSSDDERISPLERVKGFIKDVWLDSDFDGHDSDLWRGRVNVVSASLPPDSPFPTVACRMVTTAKMGNRGGVLHGGMTATIFDILTTLPLMLIARDGFWQMLGVSRDLMVTYIRPVLEGEEIEVTAELVAVGKKLACIRGTMIKVSDGSVVATCTHDKVNTDPPPSKL